MADDIIGKALGRYHVLEKLGQGGMAVVYKAFDTKLERYVAIKVILPYQEYSEQFLARFNREARVLANLTHPNIVKIFDYGEYDNHPYLVMEYIAGGTLKDWLTGDPVPWQRSAQLVARIARALDEAHKKGVIHRDVKPANILISNGKDPLLSDFGIAKLIEGNESTTSLTGTGVGIGTPDYMAPEQSDGLVDERSDIYALGAVFYQMVTGRLPYQADTPLAVMFKKITEPLPRPTQYIQDLPSFVENVLIKAMATNPENRYRNMGEFADALERLNSKADTVETRSTEAGTETSGMDKNITASPPKAIGKGATAQWVRWVVPIALFLVCLTAATAGVILWRLVLPGVGSTVGVIPATGTAEHSPAWTPTILISSPVAIPLHTATPEPSVTPTISLNGKWIAFNSRMDGDADIYMVDTDGKNLTQLTSSSAHDLYPSWSPDGTRIVYQTNEGGDQEIAIIDIATKRVRKVTENTCDDWAPVWSPADDWIVYYSNCDGDRNIYKIRLTGTNRTQLTFGSGTNWFPAWSGDGRKITFTSGRSGDYHIFVMNADGSNIKDLAEGCISYFSPDGKQILYGMYCTDTDDLFLMNADGSHPIALTNGYECKNATWSPDGRQIVFQLSQTTKDGPFALYRMFLDKPAREDWSLLADYDINGGSPVWKP
jgi:serine/threonine protein kinase